MKKSCLIIAGEKSGEDHALSFFRELRRQTPEVEYFGVGGDELEKEGVELTYHLRDFSSVGVTEVLEKLPFYFQALDRIMKDVKNRKCETAILVDFQGFNLKIAQKLHKKGVRVLYYVAPQAWAWKAYRAKSIAKCVHTLFTILPFEKKWFQQRGVKNIKAVIHPLALEFKDKIETNRVRNFSDFQSRRARILLLPGSRNSEVKSLLNVFVAALDIVRENDFDIEVGIVKVSSVKDENYKGLDYQKSWSSDELYEACQWADMSLATSGTVTLATGLFGLPAVVSYKLSLINEFILKFFIPYKGPVSLTNIIHEEYVYPEFLQYEADRYNLSSSLLKLLKDKELFNKTCEKLEKTKELLNGDEIDLPSYMAKVIEGKE